eukprot:m.33998 g.33998  ORF g.33998 m.33998 type:complete len:523 (-) comp10957_c0_seq2:235-1803(-)
MSESKQTSWFPRSPPRPCGLRVVCFHGAGCSDSIFTLARLSGKVAHNPFLQWQQDEENDVQVLGVQLPGREQQYTVSPFKSIEAAAKAFVDNCQAIFDVPYVLVGHSVGSWLAHAIALELIGRGLKPPQKLYLAAFPAPTIPLNLRPWNMSRSMNDDELKEEALAWGVNPVVLREDIWATYGPLFRADFKLFDERPQMMPDQASLGSIPITVTHAIRDTRITRELIETWRTISTRCTIDTSDGEHLFVYDPVARAAWFDRIIKDIEKTGFTRLSDESVMQEIATTILNEGHAPTPNELAFSFGEAHEAILTQLRELAEQRYLTLHPHTHHILTVPPFSQLPTSVSIRSQPNGKVWWCTSIFAALCAASVALAHEPLIAITTTLGGEDRQVRIHVRFGALWSEEDEAAEALTRQMRVQSADPAGRQPYVVLSDVLTRSQIDNEYCLHFPFCALLNQSRTQLQVDPDESVFEAVDEGDGAIALFRQKQDVEPWCRQHGFPRGRVVKLARAWELAQLYCKSRWKW